MRYDGVSKDKMYVYSLSLFFFIHETDAVLNSRTLKIMKAQTPAIKKPTDLTQWVQLSYIQHETYITEK